LETAPAERRVGSGNGMGIAREDVSGIFSARFYYEDELVWGLGSRVWERVAREMGGGLSV
jgi:hypothetical protein